MTDRFDVVAPDQARYYPHDEQYLLSRPDKVKHYEAFGELPGIERSP
jgi:hypothetical protein